MRSEDGTVGKGSDAFVGWAQGDLVDGARGGFDWLIACVVEGLFEFAVFGKVGFLCENKAVVEGEELFKMGVDGANVSGGDGKLIGYGGGG